MNQLPIPNKLYGRERDIDQLLGVFEHVSSGHGFVVLIPGPSGMGKTVLVRELHDPILARNGFFISGKFDQYQQNIPYFAFRQALVELCRELLTWDTQQLLRIKAEILLAIGNLGQVLIDWVPELEPLLGEQPALIGISPQEARHRFVSVFQNFLKAVCQPEHPLVLFVDDWQWADTASFELLKQLQTGISLRYLLIIAAYRDDEIDVHHPLTSALDHLQRHAVPTAMLRLNSLSVDNIREMVTDTFKPAIKDVAGLAAAIYDRTLGNPFFVRSFLDFLYEFDLIWLDPAQKCWCWRIDKINGQDLPVDAIGLFVLKLRRLDDGSRNLISLAACLGNRFDLEALSIISGRDVEACRMLLFSAQAMDIFLPPDYSLEAAIHGTVRFRHDRLQQAARSLIEPAELPGIQLEIGRLLLANLSPALLAGRLFEVVNNLNAGIALIGDIPEQIKAFELNVRAGRKAYAAIAYGSALQYYRTAARFFANPEIAGQLWRDRHALAMSFLNELAGCEFLEGDRDLAQQYIRQSVAHAGTALEKANALNTLIIQYTLLAKYPQAISAGQEALAALGIEISGEACDEAGKREIMQVRQALRERSVSSLMNLPVMSDPEILMAVKILITMGPPCYRAHQRLWSVIVPKVINLTLQYGNIPQIGYSHPAFGGLLAWVDDDFTTAKEFAELAAALMIDKFRSPSDQSVFHLMTGSSIRHWFSHLKHSTQDYQNAIEIGLRSGNMQYAAYAYGHDMYCQFYQSVPLPELIQQTQQSLVFSRTRLNQWAIDLLEGGLHVFEVLSGSAVAPNDRGGWRGDDYVRQLDAHHNIQVSCIYKILKTFSLIVLENYTEALALSDETEPLIFTVGTQGLLPWPEHVFARLLILTALYAKMDEKRQIQWRTELDRMMDKLRIWSSTCPENFTHKYLLATAELARINGRLLEAAEHYDRAIKAAQAGNFLQWKAIANERAGNFWQQQGSERLAHVYWQQAYVCYDRWGAIAKVQSMETAFRTYLAANFAVADETGQESGREIRNALIETQIEQLNQYAAQIRQIKLQVITAIQAEELAHAMQRLRTEIAERKRVEHYEQFRSHILELIAGNNALRSILEAIVRGVEKLNPALVCSILLLDSDGKRLQNGIAPSLPDFYNEAINGIEIGATVGSCGAAAFTAKRVVIEDIQTHPNWAPYKELAARAGLAACWSQPILSSSGKVLGTFAIYHHEVSVPTQSDIHLIEQSARLVSIAIERHMAEIELHTAATAFETHEAIMITDADARIIRVNQAFERITGYSAQEMTGQSARIFHLKRDDKSFYARMWQALLTEGTWSGELWNRHKSGHIYPVQLTITSVKNADGETNQCVAIFTDISERKQAEAAIHNLAFNDALTGLPNRRLLLERLGAALSRSVRTRQYGALLFLDLDNFKMLNDTLGHEAGDALLIEVGNRLRYCVREIDTIARLGGDEFVVLIENISADANDAMQSATYVAEKIRLKLIAPYQLEDRILHSSPSIGACLFCDDNESVDELIKRADMAMYRAKDAGKNKVRFFDPEMQRSLETRATLEADLRHAITSRQLQLYYQIQVDHNLCPIGAEALIRWNHPGRGVISPAIFIPIAEESLLILEIGAWILDIACRQLATWSEGGKTRNLTLAVNISAYQFKQPGFVEQIKRAIDKYRINPSLLKLELTESIALDDIDLVIAKMLTLKQSLGVTLSLDDFGTGYSSLSYLKRLPIHQVKIDQSFVWDMKTDAGDAVMVKTIIDMAHNFGLEVIAEGVETEEQLALLRENGCMAYQGYLFGKPVPIERFEALLQ